MMHRIYQAKEVKPGVWQRKTKIAFEIDELTCLMVLVPVVGWFVIRLLIG
jgi:hypothetical protein